jgi:GcrA cell cycle regulator
VHRLGITVRDIPTRQRTSVRSTVRTQPRARVVRDAAPVRSAPRLIEIAEMAPTSNILGLEVHSCRWPIGNPDSHDFGFCGREKTARGSYCDEHARGAFRKLASQSELKAWARQPAAQIERHIA